ncbi:DUF4255 domain-containing protein [Geodermatophilus sp. SYSU D00804]
MASHRGIESTCQAVTDLLRDNYDPVSFNQELEFRVLPSGGFATGLQAGVSLFLYRVYVGDTPRTPAGRHTGTGTRLRPELPLDLFFILTAWAREPSLQHAIAGWMMRTLEDHRVLPAGLLNRRTADVFRDDEAVEVLLADLVTEDLLHLWELFGAATYQLSVPYVARSVRLESTFELVHGAPVQDRVADYQLQGAR